MTDENILTPAVSKLLQDEIRLEKIIGDRIVLHKRGNNHVGLCPFHFEMTPSFTVTHDIFHCFGCGLTGNVIFFFEKFYNVDDRQAMAYLFKVAGINVID